MMVTRVTGDGFAMLLGMQNANRRLAEIGAYNVTEKHATALAQEGAQLTFDRAQIGRRLKMVRVGMKLSQKDMGELLDISWRTYQNYEIGQRVLPLSTACQFASIASVPVEWLALGIDIRIDSIRPTTIEIVEPLTRG